MTELKVADGRAPGHASQPLETHGPGRRARRALAVGGVPNVDRGGVGALRSGRCDTVFEGVTEYLEGGRCGVLVAA